MATQRTAEASWENDLLHGAGRVKGTTGAIPEMAISWSARTEAAAGKTSPEELLAAAHASCFAMAFSNTLAKLSHPPKRVHVRATASFEKVGDAWTVTKMELDVTGQVPGIDAKGFQEAANGAAANCPISRALKGNVAVSVTARLE